MPRDEGDLALAVDVARDAKAAILPRGAGTSQCGQTVGEALVIDVEGRLASPQEQSITRLAPTPLWQVRLKSELSHLHELAKGWILMVLADGAEADYAGPAVPLSSEELDRAFAFFDIDADGQGITEAELSAGMRELSFEQRTTQLLGVLRRELRHQARAPPRTSHAPTTPEAVPCSSDALTTPEWRPCDGPSTPRPRDRRARVASP